MKDETEIEKFYHGSLWQAVREEFKKNHKTGFCERCDAAGEITVGKYVHHKIRLTERNVHDPSVSIAWSNLELLCRNCHEIEHGKQQMRTDGEGHVEL